MNGDYRVPARLPANAYVQVLCRIADALETIAAAQLVAHGACGDCGHPWQYHGPRGCQHGVTGGRLCGCGGARPL